MSVTTFTANYFDDYNIPDAGGLSAADKNYLRILFRPGRAVQTRELNTAQSILQSQVDRLGSSLFKSNAPILGGACVFDGKLKYVDALVANGDVAQFDVWREGLTNLIASQAETTTRAIITKVEDLGAFDDDTRSYKIFLKYKSDNIADVGGEETNARTFAPSPITITDTVSGEVIQITPSLFGSAVSAKINPGFYFTKGCVAVTQEQYATILLDPTEELFTGYAVLKVSENTVTSDDDVTLLDNAAGFYNYIGIGADRYQINLTLALVEDYTDDKDYVQILQIKDSLVISEKSSSSGDNSALLESVLAQRTYEESGDYVVRPFDVDVSDLFHEDANNLPTGGRYTNIKDLADAGYTEEAARGSFAFTLSPSTAYVKGVRVDLPESNTLSATKARVTWKDLFGDNYAAGLTANAGNYVEGSFPIDNANMIGLPEIDSYNHTYNLYDVVDGDPAASPAPVAIGTCKIRTIEGLGGLNARLYLYAITITNSAKTFGDVASISDATISAEFGQFRFVLDTAGELKDTDRGSLFYELPNTPTKAVTNIEVTEKRAYTNLVESPGTTVTFTAGADEIFDKSITNIQVIYNDVSESLSYHMDTAALSSPADFTVDLAGPGADANVLKLNFVNPLSLQSPAGSWESGVDTITVIASVSSNITASRGVKTKTVVVDEAIVDSSPPGIVGEILTLSGIYHLASVDSDEFELVTDGQTAGEYKEATIRRLKAGAALISYTYWNFSGGNYYTVDSYVDVYGVGIPLEDIPSYDGVRLSDTIDLRMRPDLTDRLALDPYSAIEVELDYYLPRRDISIVNTSGDFSIVSGTPNTNADYPTTPDDAMVLHEIDIPPYTFDVSNIRVNTIDNTRYTMSDIGRIDKRVGNLEYYTTLSLLEKSANDASIYEGNRSRFKNGFVVDGFRGHNVGDPTDPNYVCSIDREDGILYPHHSGHSIPFTISEYNALLPNEVYTKSGVSDKTLTLRYKEADYMDQPFATQFISVQPHEVVSSVGFLQLHPEIDTWVDTINRPAVKLDLFSGMNDAIKFIAESTGVLGTEWNSWNTTSRTKKLNKETKWWTINEKQQRTGTSTSLASTQVEQSLGRFISEVRIRPYMRSRVVWFRASGLQASTRYYGFFDNVPVSAYIYPTPVVEGDNVLTNDLATDEGLDEATLIARYSNGDSLISDSNGVAQGSFILPNTDVLRFGSGEKVFKLSNSPRNIESEESSAAIARFISNGVEAVTNETIISSQVPRLVQTDVAQKRKVQSKKYDPVAQSFRIDENSGVCLSSVDVYFASKPIEENPAPVKVYLVTVENGYPTSTIIPGSEVILNNDLVVTSDDSTAATTFEFPSPIYLSSDQEYATVVFSTSPQYNIYISELGGAATDIATGQIVSSQPAIGVFFSSSNKTTWTAYQNRDMKIKLKRAQFDTTPAAINCVSNIGSYVQEVVIDDGGSNFTNLGATVTFTQPRQEIYDDDTGESTYVDVVGGVTTEGTPIVDANTGAITGVAITKVGWGYTDAPTVTFADPGNETIVLPIAAAILARVDVSAFTLNQVNINISDLTSIVNNVKLGAKTHTVEANAPFLDLSVKDHYVNATNNVNTQLDITLTTNNDLVTPMVDRSSLALNTRKYRIAPATDAEADTSRYISRRITLKNPGDQIDAYLAINKPSPAAGVGFFVKLYDTNDEVILNGSDKWWPVSALEPLTVPTNSDRNVFEDVRFQRNFITDAVEFVSFVVKVVMYSSNIVDVPTVKDLRVIASL